MASKRFFGYLRDPLGEYANMDKYRFTHLSTTGEVIKGSTSYFNVDSSGYYDIEIEYGNVSIDSRSKDGKRWINQGVTTINADTTATTLPALLNALVPASNELVLQLESIQKDAEDAADRSEAAADRVLKFTTDDLIYGTAADFNVGDTVETNGFYTSGDGGGTQWVKTADTDTPSQTPVDMGDSKFTDDSGSVWVLSYKGVLNLNQCLGKFENYPTDKTGHRLLVGDASDYGGTASYNEYSWLGKSDYIAPNGSNQPNLGYIERSATLAGYSSVGAIGVAGAAHTKEMTGGGALGLVGVAVNDNEIGSSNAWALYLDAKSYPGAGAATWGVEVAIANLGDYVDPYSSNTRKTYGAVFAAGADPTINGQTNDISRGINFTSNGSKWASGVSFSTGSLREYTEGSESFSKALVMRNSMQVGWESGTGDSNGYIRSNITNSNTETSILMSNDNINFRGSGANNILKVSNLGGDYLNIQSRNGNPRIITEGDSTNIDFRIETKGNGTIDFAGGISAQLSSDPSGFTADEILTIKVNGVNYRIPVRKTAW